MLQFSVGGNCSRHNDMNSCKQGYLIETKALGQVYVNLDPGKTYVAQFRNPQEYWGLVGQEKQVEAALNADYDQLVLVSGNNNSPQGGQKSGCLIATTAFGSELTPQV